MSGIYFPNKTELSFHCACGHAVKQFLDDDTTAAEIAEIREVFSRHKCGPCFDTSQRYKKAKEKRDREAIRAHLNLFTGRY
jgi:hypothetical protein